MGSILLFDSCKHSHSSFSSFLDKSLVSSLLWVFDFPPLACCPALPLGLSTKISNVAKLPLTNDDGTSHFSRRHLFAPTSKDLFLQLNQKLGVFPSNFSCSALGLVRPSLTEGNADLRPPRFRRSRQFPPFVSPVEEKQPESSLLLVFLLSTTVTFRRNHAESPQSQQHGNYDFIFLVYSSSSSQSQQFSQRQSTSPSA